MGIGKVEHFLSSVSQTKTFHSAGAESDQSHPLLMAFLLLVLIGMQERQKAPLSFRDVPGDAQERSNADDHQRPQILRACSCHEHHEQNCSANQERRSEIGLQQYGDEKRHYHDNRVDQSHKDPFAFRLKFREPPRNKNDRHQLGQFRGLKRHWSGMNPTPGTIDSHSDRTNEAES